MLDAPTEQHDGQSVYYRYEHETEEVLRVSFNTQSETAATQRVRAYIEQPSDTVLDRYRFRFKPDPQRAASATIYLRPPPVGHADTLDTYRDAGWAVVAGEYQDDRRVTTRLELLVHGTSQSELGLPSVLVAYEVRLSGVDDFDATFVARDQQTLDIQRAT